MGKDFLENLKKAVDDGEFNSEAANKVNSIDKLADVVGATGGAGANIEKRINESGMKTVSEEKAVEANSEYETKMAAFKLQDLVNNQIAMLIDIDDMIAASIEDLFLLSSEIKNKFKKEFDDEVPVYGELSLKIDEIEKKYSTYK